MRGKVPISQMDVRGVPMLGDLHLKNVVFLEGNL